MPHFNSLNRCTGYVRFFSCLLFLALTCFDTKPTSAQATALKSVIAFELKPRQLSNHALVRLATKNANPEAKRLAKADRILGYVSLPTDPRLLQDLSVDEAIPFDFIITIDFSSKSDRMAAIGENELQYLERITKKGKTFYTYPSDNSNLVLIVQDTKVEFGTSNYLSMTDRDFATPSLAKQFESIREAPIRIAADLEGARTFVNAALDLQAQIAKPPAWFVPFRDVPKKSSAMNLSVDFESEQLVKFESYSATDAEAQYVGKAMKAVIGLAQLGLKEDKKAAAIGRALLVNAQPVTESNVAMLTIKRPEKLDELLKKILAQ